jgi:putative membrane protein
MDLKQLFKSWVIVAFGVLIASNTASGIHYDSREALIIVVILLSACNVFLKPLLMLFSLPFIILTFGIGIWVINALLFLFVAALVSGFHIDSFGSALWGALVVSITSGVATLLFGDSSSRRSVNINVGRVGPTPSAGPQARGSSQPRQPKRVIEDDADVIDI